MISGCSRRYCEFVRAPQKLVSPQADRVARGFAAADQEQIVLPHQFVVAQLLAVDLGVQPDADQIVAALLLALGQDLFVKHREVGERLHHLLGDFTAVAALDVDVGPVQHFVAAGPRVAEHLTDHVHRQRSRDVAHQVALAAGGDAIEQLVDDAADRILEPGDAARSEALAHQPALASVVLAVLVDHRLVRPHVGRDTGHHTVAAAKDLGVFGDEQHVFVTRDRPELVFGVPVQRLLLAHPLVERLRGKGVMHVDVEQINVLERHRASRVVRECESETCSTTDQATMEREVLPP